MSIKISEYTRRRRDLMAQMGTNTIAIIAGAAEQVRSRDTHYPFRQDSDFSYLCGFPEPDALLVLVPGREQGQSLLFCRDKDRTREIWDGFRYGPEGAVEAFALDDAFPVNDIDDILPGLLEGKEKVFHMMGKHPELDTRLLGWIQNIRQQARVGATPPGEIVELEQHISEMRLIKSAAEIKVMRRAAQISAEAHCKAMALSRPGLYEYQLQAEIEHWFAHSGAIAPAYSSIVGSGENACVLHYIENRDELKNGDLVLIDAGCEYQGYAGDITRTFPVNGTFSDEQAALYDIVLAAQLAAIEACRPGASFIEPHERTVSVITQGLLDLGLLQGSLEDAIENKTYAEFYMHRAGHWLGMDVHDVGEYKIDGRDSAWRVFEPGMMTTIEPGIYIHMDNKQVDKKWRGIGIRIEDDVLITKTGCDVMTGGVPKTRAEIESFMATAASSSHSRSA